ncbi:MAG: type II toxin-antitoxin system VapC family toxin [Moorea sp. SIO2B7]|nr:type II toxin-antitoxin system VapC family toxin [Moorena sp. SIO2B7]
MSLNAIFIDTSYIIALINERDDYHHEALDLANRYDGYPFIISEPILLEVGNALCRNYKVEASQIINHFLEADDVEVISLTSDLLKKAFDLYQQYQDKYWVLVDCISFIIMKENKINHVLTFDRYFSQAGFHILS